MKVNGLETSAPLVGALCYDSAWREGEFVARSVSTDARSNAAKAPEVVDPTSAEGPIANERPSSTRIHHGGEGTVASALAFFCLISFCFGRRPPKNSAACLDAEADGVNACRCLLVVCSPMSPLSQSSFLAFFVALSRDTSTAYSCSSGSTRNKTASK